MWVLLETTRCILLQVKGRKSESWRPAEVLLPGIMPEHYHLRHVSHRAASNLEGHMHSLLQISGSGKADKTNMNTLLLARALLIRACAGCLPKSQGV